MSTLEFQKEEPMQIEQMYNLVTRQGNFGLTSYSMPKQHFDYHKEIEKKTLDVMKKSNRFI